jgi:hypothetical protein
MIKEEKPRSCDERGGAQRPVLAVNDAKTGALSARAQTAAKTMPKISVGNFFQLSGSLRHHKPNHVVHFSQDTYDVYQLLEKPVLCRRAFQCQKRLQGHGS